MDRKEFPGNEGVNVNQNLNPQSGVDVMDTFAASDYVMDRKEVPGNEGVNVNQNPNPQSGVDVMDTFAASDYVVSNPEKLSIPLTYHFSCLTTDVFDKGLFLQLGDMVQSKLGSEILIVFCSLYTAVRVTSFRW
ncbi:unnamed protein product [Gongylonema pulchrum]|uniref:Ovule protein n=1 Tax=Gongylonema pulchrum TaxID=637853 RepID=A0A183E6F1_9BILA|nr:unnamed protein product [Gongylonema pulchrum]